MSTYHGEWCYRDQDQSSAIDTFYKINLCKQVEHVLDIEPSGYTVSELERIVDKIQEIEMYCDSVMNREEVYTGNSQDPRSEEMYIFKDMFDWNYISAEQMDDLLDYHGELQELLEN